ncbi:MAG: HDOD domain-containing protein [Proteobacteria bacterium]|nr:HDOD domain-containing protein [Pseudomonadota bacterium]MBU1584765.1 HDOD domain-containing protein [Pseudomonadota bacterium]MBU2455221.1 HDOD domain-containing protein [Pseudomonadota bacterium]MBU2631566.1 HDOD domain-containing protein [Pseudomonadota bacterium]
MEIKTEILKMIQKKESDLPTLPVVIDRIISVASEEKTTTEDLADVISYDQGMTNKLLKLANSIYYAQKTKVETIKRSITVIGFDEIIGIALGMGILSSFTDKSGLNLDMKALWIHGIGVATVSKELAKRTNPGIANKIFIPALLHDMGKVIFSVYFKDEYRKVRQLAMEKKRPLYFAENAIFKLDHAVLSALLMKRWNFPLSIMLPCRFHHNPESAPIKFRHQSLIINLADYLTQKAGIGHSGNPVPVTVKNSPKKIGINPSILKLTIDQLKRKEDEIKEFFNITTEP